MSWSFRPSPLIVFATLIGLALTLTLGVWQIERGHGKAALLKQYTAASASPPVNLRGLLSSPATLMARSVFVRGTYLQDRQLLLDGQFHEQTPGYDVWTPLAVEGGGLVIVDRGWIPAGGERRAAAAPSAPLGEVVISGLWRTLPRAGYRIRSGLCDAQRAAAPTFPLIVDYPDAAELGCALGASLADGEVLLAPAASGGFVREWTQSPPGFPPERHYAYAAQWFALAATLLFLFVRFNLKRKP